MKYALTCITALSLSIAMTGYAQAAQPVSTDTVFTQSEQGSTPITTPIIDGKGARIGIASFTQLAKGVQVDVAAAGLKPGMHGIHIHETGKCDLPDFKSSGAHFNPTTKEHGYNNSQGEHAGDLPNLIAGQDGSAKVQFVMTNVTLQKGAGNSLLKEGGTALIIHMDADDMHTNPSGNSGDRIGCAVIR